MKSRENLVIIPSEEGKKSGDYSKNYAIMVMTTGIEDDCSSYDPFGMDLFLECPMCSNCNYRIDFLDGTHFESNRPIRRMETEIERYCIELFDPVCGRDFAFDEGKSFFSYLESEESNYRIVRMGDRIIMHEKGIENVKVMQKKRK